MMKLITLVFSLSFAVSASADRLFLLERARQEKQIQPFLGGPSVIVKPGTFEQNTDHLEATATPAKFKQRYWYSSTNSKNRASPVVLYLCGEGQCGSGSLTFGPLPSVSKNFGAHLFALEHRYYGKSQPFSDLSTENLRYLKTEQVLADVLHFKKSMQTQLKLTGPWIVVGGSYAGNLAAYLRSLYPNDFVAALASSAPVLPQKNFEEYDRHVARLAGKACISQLQNVLQQIENRLENKTEFEKLKVQFQSSGVSRVDDFLQVLSDFASHAIQLGMKDEFCQAVKADGIDGYARVASQISKQYGSYAQYTAEVAADVSLAKHQGSFGMRQWYYQSCTEYGYWQYAYPDKTESARSAQINARYFNEICVRLFGIDAQETDLVQDTYYKPLQNRETSRVLMTNGSLDPWSKLSVTLENENAVNPKIELFSIEGGLHCEDLTVGGSDRVLAAKAKFQSLLRTWLTAPNELHPRSESL